jgi:hypothetical protein
MNLSVDWNSVFVPAIGLAEIVVRGSLMYPRAFRDPPLHGASPGGTFRAC